MTGSPFIRSNSAQVHPNKVWLFAMVLGHSHYLWGQFVMHQDSGTVLRCHMEAFEHFCGVSREILYDRMQSAVLGEAAGERPIIYNDQLLNGAPTTASCRVRASRTVPRPRR